MKYISTVIMAVLVTACSVQPTQTGVDIVQRSDDYWEVALAESFRDGGSVALGLLNCNGEMIYVWAESTWDQPGKQKLYLKLNYNDPDKVEITEGSELEVAINEMLVAVKIRPFLESHQILVDDFKAVLNNRTNQVSRFWYKKVEEESSADRTNPETHSFSRKMCLDALGEKSWTAESQEFSEAYRFTRYPSFHGPVAVTVIVNSDGTGTMTVKVAEGACGQGRVGEIIHSSETQLSVDQVNQLRAAKAEVVVKPTQEFVPWVFQGADGATWCLETLLPRYYAKLSRWSPSHNEAVKYVFLNEDAVPLSEHGGLFDDDRLIQYDKQTQDDIKSYIETNERLVEFVRLLLSWSPLSAEEKESILKY